MIAAHQLKTFRRILDEYTHGVPLHKFLPGFYRQNKQMGSKDRKMASALIYSYFRFGKVLPELDTDERLFLGLFLSSDKTLNFLEHFRPDLAETIHLPSEQKIRIVGELYPEFRVRDIFPFEDHLSNGIDPERFIYSFLDQPSLFLRIRKGAYNELTGRLADAGIAWADCNNDQTCISLPNHIKLDELFGEKERRYYEVQDSSSQYTTTFFKPGTGEYWWDCCAASGGKSLALFEQEQRIKILASDIRDSMLTNLDERFNRVGLTNYERRKFDLRQPVTVLRHQTFDGIILDAPCSGSGTWARTPEMLSAFDAGKIVFFQHLQKDIAANVVPFLKPGKPLVYITCSVFKEENEQVKDFLVNDLGMVEERSELVKGYENRADTMYVARLIRP